MVDTFIVSFLLWPFKSHSEMGPPFIYLMVQRVFRRFFWPVNFWGWCYSTFSCCRTWNILQFFFSL